MKKARNIRDIIIKTALELFGKRSYDEVTVNDICSAAHISRTSFYSAFAGKKDLIVAVMHERSTFQNIDTTEMLALENDFERMIHILKFHIGIWDPENIGLCKTMLTLEINENIGIFEYSHAYDPWYEKLIKNCQHSGIIRNMGDPLQLTEDCIQISKGYVIDWCRTNGSFDLLYAIRAAVERLGDVAPEYRKCE